MFEESPFKKQNPNVIEVPLLETSQKWEENFELLMKDDFLSKKYNRGKRLNDHLLYLKNLAPEVLTRTSVGSYVVDIGPGPGELLEISRFLGYKTKGFDAKLEDCEMGKPYLQLSMMMSERQNLDIEYCGFENILSRLPLETDSTFLVNSRGSIEQVFKKHLEGVPHKVHHDAKQLAWTFSDEMKSDFLLLLNEVKRILVPGGIFLIYGNGSSNISEYNDFVFSILEEVEGLTCEASDYKTIHRMRKL